MKEEYTSALSRIEKPFNELSEKDAAFFIKCYSYNLGMYDAQRQEILQRCFILGNPVCVIDFKERIVNITTEGVPAMKVILRQYLKLH